MRALGRCAWERNLPAEARQPPRAVPAIVLFLNDMGAGVVLQGVEIAALGPRDVAIGLVSLFKRFDAALFSTQA